METQNFNENNKVEQPRKFLYIIIIALVVIALAGLSLYTIQKNTTIAPPVDVQSFEECEKAGYPIMESYPRQCKTPDGISFTEEIGNEIEKLDKIQITKPRPNQKILSPLVIQGQARGTWYFEASFPVTLQDDQGNVLAQGHAEAQSDWMTENFVPFTSNLTFTPPVSGKGKLLLHKDNPSGLPENNDELWLPVSF